MIFCRSKQFIFLRVSKNASTSLSLQIQKNLDFQPGDFATSFHSIPAVRMDPEIFGDFQFNEHATLEIFLSLGTIDPAEIESYSIYGVFRNPVDRFFSLFPYFISTSLADKNIDVSIMTKDEVAELAFGILEGTVKAGSPYGYTHKIKRMGQNVIMYNALFPQTRWLIHDGKPINNIVVYPNFDDMLIKLTGSNELQFKEKVGKKPIDSPISKSTLEGIKYWYAPDFDLWEKMGYNK